MADLVSTRRGIVYPNPDRSGPADLPGYIGNLIQALEADVFYAQDVIGNRPVSTPGVPGKAGRIFVDTGVVPHEFHWDYGTGWEALRINRSGTYINRPAIGTVGAGTTYFATDTLGRWISDGTNWILISQGRPQLTPAQFATLLTSIVTPYDLQEVSLIFDATNGIKNHFQYNAGSASANKWENIGGPPLLAVTATNENITPNTISTWGDGASIVGPSVTIPRSGDYTARWTVQATAPVASPAGYFDVGVKRAATNPIISADDSSRIYVPNVPTSEADIRSNVGIMPQKAATAGDVWKLVYQMETVVGWAIGGRRLEVIPIRIS